MASEKTFSIGWFFLATLLHAAGTYAFWLADFAGGMSSFTTGSGSNGALLWMWTPLAMSMRDSDIAFLVALIWSAFVGILAGHFGGLVRTSPVMSPSSSDTAGTPWEKDPGHTFGSKRDKEESHLPE